MNVDAAAGLLRHIGHAQFMFRDGDLDGNGVADFWRQDVRGLVRFRGDRYGDGRIASLIVPEAALADDRGVGPVPPELAGLAPPPESGFRVRAIRFRGESEPDRRRWAICCYPARYGPGIRSNYIMSHAGHCYRKDLGPGRVVEEFPDDPLEEGWKSVH